MGTSLTSFLCILASCLRQKDAQGRVSLTADFSAVKGVRSLDQRAFGRSFFYSSDRFCACSVRRNVVFLTPLFYPIKKGGGCRAGGFPRPCWGGGATPPFFGAIYAPLSLQPLRLLPVSIYSLCARWLCRFVGCSSLLFDRLLPIPKL